MSERTRININLDIKTKTLKILKKLYETQTEMGVISNHYNTLDSVAMAMVDEVLTDVRLQAKDEIKRAIINHSLEPKVINDE